MTVTQRSLACLITSCMLIAACSTGDAISESGEKFDEVSTAQTVSLVGTEPFWAIEIEPGKSGVTATYSDPEKIEGRQFPVERFEGNNGLGFSGALEDDAVQIALTPGDCNDGMSDRTYPYTATVKLGERTLFGCGYTDQKPFEGDEMP